jgi:hypothetical protein
MVPFGSPPSSPGLFLPEVTAGFVQTTLPMLEVSSLSKIGSNVVPRLVVRQSPPVAYATKNAFGLPGSKQTSLTRPPIVAGPTLLQGRRLRSSDESFRVAFWSSFAAFAGMEIEYTLIDVDPQVV